jgi:anti-sigma regulatory factor (Ser/Thr protein kinase)
VARLGGLTVRHAAASAGQVRRRLVEDLNRLGLPHEFVDNAALLASELIGNAVRYARPLPGNVLRVSWELARDRLLLRVTDGGGREQPQMKDAGPSDTRGRGLAIVDAVAAAWGVERGLHAAGVSSTVWAELSLVRAGAQPVGAGGGSAGSR